MATDTVAVLQVLRDAREVAGGLVAGIPANDEDLAEIGRQLQVALPADYALFLRETGGAILGGREFLVLGGIARQHIPMNVIQVTSQARASGAVSGEKIVVALEGDGALIAIECGEGGQHGHVTLHQVDRGAGETAGTGLASSFGEFLKAAWDREKSYHGW